MIMDKVRPKFIFGAKNNKAQAFYFKTTQTHITYLCNEVILKIHELCQPCMYLQKKLNIENLVKLLVNKSGIQTEVLTSGTIKVKDIITVID